jgi:phage baseplate assembly protein W
MDNTVRDKEFVGQGLAFPLQINQQGGIALARGAHDVEQSIHVILATMPGERRMRPEFGCRIHELVFAPDNPATQGLAVYYVKEALDNWEPRIEVQDVHVSSDRSHDGVLLIEIQYEIKDTHDQRSIVYPFFLTAEEEW